ncbi:MAG: nicotinamidase [Candidatus Infernicultor aquiphilus]|uniref:Nicotinamidase n=2 Tax=Candidatus Infernicultor aquiphilus TaxID=1805029 RepID=A0A2M8C9J6_9BACT|nr:MAG: nicotinamidase [Candidatus Atribacteria bacterium CG_4_8_14_3_um_filter_34_18]PIY33251.1 MAG: nicotinamidase [Candidatus Atribacteria bacterium CG_4_10_14_3_um_filter_34_13]PJB55737.1 MAG: nicotinamidase [Candidatus Atribacteria bacterium CG_4_9_14_3_um_filter_33_16]
MNRKVLLVIDMLNDFIKEDGKLYIGDSGGKIILPIQKEIENFRKEKDLIFYICDYHRPDDKEFNLFPPHCISGTKGAEIIKELVPFKNDFIIYKRRFSGFFQTDLDISLREEEILELELVGVCTNICVLYTAASARMLNYKVTVLKDAVASFDEQAHNFALKQMKDILGVEIR